jgi:hypothetical protein
MGDGNGSSDCTRAVWIWPIVSCDELIASRLVSGVLLLSSTASQNQSSKRKNLSLNFLTSVKWSSECGTKDPGSIAIHLILDPIATFRVY